MDESTLHFLKKLVETPSPSGYEQPVQRLFREYTSGIADEVETDILGNVTAALHRDGAPRLMLKIGRAHV